MPKLEDLLALQEMPRVELVAFRERLAAKVTKRSYGDGLETYEDFILPQYAETQEMFEDAKQLYWVRVQLGELGPHEFDVGSDPLTKAVLHAVNTLRKSEIKYYGLKQTYVYWSGEQARYVQISAADRQKALRDAQREIGFRFRTDRYAEGLGNNLDLPERDHPSITTEQREVANAWLLAHPSRGSESLSALIALDLLEPNTPLWHALTVIDSHEKMARNKSAAQNTSERDQLCQEDVAELLQETAELGFLMGKSASALEKKPLEYEVISLERGKHARAKASGEKSAASREKRIEAFMSEIEILGDIFPRVSEAVVVNQAFQNAVEKNRKLWRQGAGQMEEYLSQDLRSKEPFKARYFAIFGKTA